MAGQRTGGQAQERHAPEARAAEGGAVRGGRTRGSMAEQTSRSRLERVLSAAGLPIDERDFTDALEALLGEGGRRTEAPLTEAEETYLREDPGVELATDSEVAEALAQGAAAVAEVAATSWSGAEVARRAGVDASTVRHWVADGDVVTIGSGTRRRFPPVQLGEDGRPLPGMRQVLAALPPGWHPLSLHRWLTTPSRDLERGDERVSPRQWLLEGAPVEPVVASARAVEAEARTDPREAADARERVRTGR